MESNSSKCAKCGKSIPQGEGKQTAEGLICNSCASKNRRLLAAIAGVIVAAAAAVGITVGVNYTKDRDPFKAENIKSFEGVGNINDSVETTDVGVKTFDISTVTALSSNTTVGEAVDNIESFKSRFEANKNNLSGEDKTVVIPSIAVLFTLNSSEVDSSAKALVSEFAKAYCSTDKSALIEVDGYTCDLGTDVLNNALSVRRSSAVKNILVDAGVPSEKIIIKGYGKSMYGKLGLEGREANRRVNILIK